MIRGGTAGKSKKQRTLRFKLLLCISTWVLQFGVWAVGIIFCDASNPLFLAVNAMVAVLVACIAFIPSFSRWMPVVFSLAAALLFLIAIDLAIRFTLPELLYYRPHEMFVRRDSARPYLLRYLPNMRYRRSTYGDLAAMSGDRALREVREISFFTDAYGFRNEPSREGGPYDVLILGDSFGVGTGTAQEETWAGMLDGWDGMRAYNLSMPGGPWTHFMNLQIEFDRLEVRAGATVLLALFSGNDLDDFIGPSNDPAELEYCEGWERFRLAFDTFRRRSSLVKLWKIVTAQGVGDATESSVRILPFPGNRRMAFYIPYVDRARRTISDVLSHSNCTRFLRVLNDLLLFCRDRSLNLKIMLIPSKAEVYDWVLSKAPPWSSSPEPSGLSELLQSFCSDNNIEYRDLKPPLISRSKKTFLQSGSLLWWYDDTHLNPTGHDALFRVGPTELINK